MINKTFLEDFMKKQFFLIAMVFAMLTGLTALSGCSSPAGSTFALEAPGVTATWNVEHTWITWSKVAGADYYVVYGKQFIYTDPPPTDLKNYTELYKTANSAVNSFDHVTLDDYVYAVKAFTNDGRSSDFSNIAFTW
jgi:hypothetical protein